MPEKHVYFSLGALAGSGICVLIGRARHSLRQHSRFFQWLYKKEPHWFLYFPIIIFLVGLWGLVPDLVYLLGIFPKEFTRSGWFDIFFFHSTLENIESTNRQLDTYLNWFGEVVLLVICFGVMFFYIGQVKRAISERQR